MKLIEITFQVAPRLPGVPARDLTAIKIENPPGSMLNWRVSLRGASVFFISPPGWRPSSGMPEVKGCTIHEVPRINCFLYWQGTPEEIANVAKYDSAPLGPEKEVVRLEIAMGDTQKTVEPPTTKPGGLLSQVPGIL